MNPVVLKPLIPFWKQKKQMWPGCLSTSYEVILIKVAWYKFSQSHKRHMACGSKHTMLDFDLLCADLSPVYLYIPDKNRSFVLYIYNLYPSAREVLVFAVIGLSVSLSVEICKTYPGCWRDLAWAKEENIKLKGRSILHWKTQPLFSSVLPASARLSAGITKT